MNYTDHTTAVATRLVDMIRTGSHGEWVMPWHTHGTAALFNTRNAITGTPYTGANTVALFLDALERGFPTADYATFNQYRKAGAQVRKGERAAYVIKWVTPKNRTTAEHSTTDHTDGEHVERRLVPKVYAVFNAHQVDGHDPQPVPTTDTPADQWLVAAGADVVYGGDRAYYARPPTGSTSPTPTSSTTPKRSSPPPSTNTSTGPDTAAASTGSTSPPTSEAPSTPQKSSSPSSAPPSPPPAPGD